MPCTSVKYAKTKTRKTMEKKPTKRKVSGSNSGTPRPSAFGSLEARSVEPNLDVLNSDTTRTKPNANAAGSRANRSVTARSGASNSRQASPVVASSNIVHPKTFIFAIAFIVIALVLIFCIKSVLLSGKENNLEETTENTTISENTSVSFVAVGDNLPENILGSFADAQKGVVGDGLYDYSSIYAPIKQYIQEADFAYVKEEVHLDDELGVHGYPSFNAPESLADDLIATGFDVIGSASNHIYDWGYFGACARNREVWNSKDVTFVGSNLNEEEANTIATLEIKGITFAILDYTYGVNGYSESDLEWYEVNFISKDRIASDVARAKELADATIVAMHWGTENQTQSDDYQLEYAQYLADLGVDLVLGSHPHVIGDVSWVEGENGNKTLVCYSLGNFLSHHDYPDAYNELEGMISCNFVKNAEGKISIEDVAFIPLVNHTDDENSDYVIYAVKDYSNELASHATALNELDDAIEWLHNATLEIIGEDITIDDGYETSKQSASEEQS